MDVDATATLSAPVDEVLAALADLSTYPRWLHIVAAATALEPDGRDPGPAWAVDLVGRLGPLRKTKRVRMVRAEADPARGMVRFERAEHDGRHHNSWVLTCRAEADATGATNLHVHLHYGGGSILPGADRLLGVEAGRAGARLDRLLGRGHRR